MKKKIYLIALLLGLFIHSNAQNITRIEYFFDTDPGLGNGISVPITPNTNISNLPIMISTTNLNLGFHTLFIRSRDNLGNWSLTNNSTFSKIPLASQVTPITYVEYFIDTDPGFGNATSVPITSGLEVPNLNISIDILNLSLGIHQLSVRSKDALGRWSITNQSAFTKIPFASSTANIIKMEYFIDTDPGFGNGIIIPFNSGVDIVALSLPIDVTSLSFGYHNLFVRSLDTNGNWSITNSQLFSKQNPLNIKLFLQGYYAGNGTMNSTLLNEGVLNAPITITDTITVELHNSISPFSVIASAKTILNTDGTATLGFDNIDFNSPYYIVVKHRNSIETWSANPVTMSSNTTYDFTTAVSKAYGNNQVQLEPNVFGIYSGDINQDDYIDGADYPAFDYDASIGLFGVYVATDLNGDGFVDGADYPLFDANSSLGVFVITP